MAFDATSGQAAPGGALRGRCARAYLRKRHALRAIAGRGPAGRQKLQPLPPRSRSPPGPRNKGAPPPRKARGRAALARSVAPARPDGRLPRSNVAARTGSGRLASLHVGRRGADKVEPSGPPTTVALSRGGDMGLARSQPHNASTHTHTPPGGAAPETHAHTRVGSMAPSPGAGTGMKQL